MYQKKRKKINDFLGYQVTKNLGVPLCTHIRTYTLHIRKKNTRMYRYIVYSNLVTYIYIYIEREFFLKKRIFRAFFRLLFFVTIGNPSNPRKKNKKKDCISSLVLKF